MSDADIIDTIQALCLLAAALFLLLGFALPMRDSAARFTWRYFGWGSLAAYWTLQGSPIRWASILSWSLALFALYRTSHWWNQAEKRRQGATR